MLNISGHSPPGARRKMRQLLPGAEGEHPHAHHEEGYWDEERADAGHLVEELGEPAGEAALGGRDQRQEGEQADEGDQHRR